MTTMTKKLTLFAAILGLICFSLVSCGDLLNGIAGGAGGSSSAQSPVVNTPDETSFSIHYGETATLSITATVDDRGTLSYQWYKGTSNNRDNASPITGATSASYIVTAPNAEVAKTYYWCKVTNTKSGTTGYNWSYDFDVTVSNIIRLGGEYISSNTTWNATYTYYISSWVDVERSLVIPAGTVIKFKNGAYFETSDSGTITVQGTEENPVIFTSYLDDVGITIPEFANSATSATKGDWKGVRIDGAAGSKIEYAVFRYSDEFALKLRDKKTTVNHCVFTDNKSNNDFSGALIIEENANESVVTNNVFYNNDYPLLVSANYSVDTSNIFHNPDDTEVKNVNQAIVMDGGKYIEQSKIVNWKVTELPYFLKDSWVDVETGGTLNIGDADHDVIVKFNNDCYIEIDENAFFTLGANSILTSWKDDAHGGDIEGNGQPAAPEDGDWKGISVYGAENWGWGNEINKDEDCVLYNDKSLYQN